MQVLHEIGSPALAPLDEKTWSVVYCFDPTFDPWTYDTDGDCYISAHEFSFAMNDYNQGRITLAQLETVTTLWENGIRNPACGVPPECETDADCVEKYGEGYVCRNGKCVREGEFPWMWLAIGGAALAGAILLIPKEKAKEIK